MSVLGIKDSTTKLEDLRPYDRTDKTYFSILNRPVQDLEQRDLDLDLIHKPSRFLRVRATDPISDQVDIEEGFYLYGNAVEKFAGTTLAAVPASGAGTVRIDLVYFRTDTNTVVRLASAQAANYGAVTKPDLPAGLDAIPLAYLYVGDTGPEFEDGLAINIDGAIEDARPAPGSGLGRPVETSAGTFLPDTVGGSAGSSEKVPRADHRHPLNIADGSPPVTLSAATVANAGEDDFYARRDHEHALSIETNAAVLRSDVSGGDVGVATTLARADHRHPLNVSGAAPSPVGITAGSAGSSGAYARADHRHDVEGVLKNYAGLDRGKCLWGEVTAAGAISKAGSGGWTVVRNGLGFYTITFTVAFPNIPIILLTTLMAAPATQRVAQTLLVTTGACDVFTSNSGGSAVDAIFAFQAISQ